MKTTDTCRGLSDQGAFEHQTSQTVVLPARTRGYFLRALCHSGDAHTTTLASPALVEEEVCADLRRLLPEGLAPLG